MNKRKKPTLKDSIKAQVYEKMKVDLPTLKGDIYVRRFNTREIIELEQVLATDRDAANVKMVMLSAVDEYGNLIFQKGDEKLISDLPLADYFALVFAAIKHNHLEKKSVEEIEKK